MSHMDEKDIHPNTSTRIGYVRVSTVTQTLEQQQAALDAAGAVKTFSDTMSGARDDRPGLAELMAYVREGDTVVVWKLDRLGRNTLHILETVNALTDRRVSLVSVTDGINSSTAAGRMMIGVLGSLAEYERELIKERTALKRASSRANGTKWPNTSGVTGPARIPTAGCFPAPVTRRCPPTRPPWRGHGALRATRWASATGCTTCATSTPLD
jgi:DNA invertase Pin-like site-specific DNA recombinase